jgi:hypothetical protein
VLRVCAVSLDGARSFDRMVRTTPAPDAYLAALMELDDDAVDSAQPLEEVEREFQEFCDAPRRGPDSDSEGPGFVVLVTWEPRILRRLRSARPQTPSVLLKGVWGNVSRVRVGGLESVVEALDLAVPQGPVTGRAGRRLMLACAMTHHLRGIRPDDA